ncbi:MULTISPECIES: peptidoglycan-binding protein [unclassified Streptomyces]|uniref:peptidoglycan-binding domain-containing protein n=1 Tax=unclassified Streptomyces TaxID=2593676 RepID=UPI00236565B9|nr:MULTISPECIES: peptidoglycan-binding protein [unclassified Streptomyces]MDF3144727.1 Tat pathway signal protein [Streptomyces sp. T21Q-yed]WDF36051.1 Tat pathway signal protein [Streptomyces sp. T12]
MSLRSAHARIATGVISAIAAGTLALSASPASAHSGSGDGYVRGYDSYKDDWDDEGTLGWTPEYFPHSNAACLWQKILWAEGALYKEGGIYKKFPESEIDGNFGPNTRHATVSLQAAWDLDTDGKVGSKTFGRAENQLKVTGGSEDRGKQLNFTYYGDTHSFSVVRNKEGKYAFRDGDDKWRIAGYNYLSCS